MVTPLEEGGTTSMTCLEVPGGIGLKTLYTALLILKKKHHSLQSIACLKRF